MDNNKPIPRKYVPEKKEAVESKKVTKVISGEAKTKKKSDVRKFSDIFISEDASNVKSYIFSDVFVPAIKNLISAIVTDGIDMILFGGKGGGDRKRSVTDRVSFTSYDRYFDKKDRFSRSEPRSRAHDFDDVVVRTRGDAESVLDEMDNLLEKYKMVSVADLYELVGLVPKHTDYNFGWLNLNSAKVVRLRDGGYTFSLPKAMPLD